jgi:predicted amino acid dehydrogenase
LKQMAFLAHWVETWNLLFLISNKLRQNPEQAVFYYPLFPVCFVISTLLMLSKKPFDIVDNFHFNVNNGERVASQTALLRNFGFHFFLPFYRPSIRDRVIQSVLSLQETNNVIGLGALVKDERITKGGGWIVEELGDSLKVPIIHGDTLTAATVFRQVLVLYEKYNIDTPLFLTGATSKIGRALALTLARNGHKVKMYTRDQARFDAIQNEAGASAPNLFHVTTIEEGRNCKLWVTGKAIPRGKELLSSLPEDAIVINFAVPNPLSAKTVKNNPSIKLFEGGLLAYDPAQTNLSFTMRLKPGLTYACHAATFVHCWKGWKHHEVGPVDITEMDKVWTAAQDAGFHLYQD